MTADQYHDTYGGYILRNYISQLQQSVIEANTADYRGTSQEYLDDIASKARERFSRAGDIVATLDAATISRCERLEEYYHPRYRWSKLGEFTVEGKRVLGPWWLSRLDEVRRLQDILK